MGILNSIIVLYFSLEGNKHKWVPLHLDDVKSDSQDRPGSRNSSRSQPETNKLVPQNNRRNETRISKSFKIIPIVIVIYMFIKVSIL